MMRVWQRWVDFWSVTEPGTVIALFRIAVGLVMVGTVLNMFVQGVIDVVWLNPDAGGYATVDGSYFLWRWLGGPTPDTVYRVTWATAFAGLAMTLGLGGRLPILLTLQGAIALFELDPASGGGHDRLLTNALWLLFLADSTRTLSVDARLRTGAWRDPTPIPSWPRHLAILQLIIMYSTTGLQKVGAEWWPTGGYTAVWYVMNVPVWQRFDLGDLSGWFWLTRVATAWTMVFEIGALVLLLFYFARRFRPSSRLASPWIRRFFVLTGVGFHLSLWALLELGPFSPASLCFYLCLFHPDEMVKTSRASSENHRGGKRPRGTSSAPARTESAPMV